MSKTDLPILEQRRIEANIIKPIYERNPKLLRQSRLARGIWAAWTF